MKRRSFAQVACMVVAGLCLLCCQASAGYSQQWSRIMGVASNDEYGLDVVVDYTGAVYVAGYTPTNFDGKSNPGGQSVCVVKWDPSGTQEWSLVFGSQQDDTPQACAVDSYSCLFVAGSTVGEFGMGQTNNNIGLNDVFLTKCLPAGTVLTNWMWGSVSNDYAYGVAVHTNDDICVAGYTEFAFGQCQGTNQVNEGSMDLFLTRLTPGGSQLWTRVWGSTVSDYGRDVAVDGSGNSYVVGYTYGAFDGQTNPGPASACLTKFSPSGLSLWTRIWGSSLTNFGEGVAVDASGAIYVAGSTYGEFDSQSNTGNEDAFLTKFDPSGNRLWTRIWGSTNFDCGMGVAVQGTNAVFVSGYTGGAFHGQTNNGGIDIFMTAWDTAGSNVASVIWGSTKDESGTRVAMGIMTNLYVTGYTKGAFGGQAQSDTNYKDLFVTKLAEVSMLSAPTGVTASYGTYTDKIRVTWNPVAGATGFEVWFGVDNTTNSLVFVAGVTNTIVDDYIIPPGSLSYFFVRATNSVSVSDFSVPSAGLRGILPPTGISASDGYTNMIRVTWNAVTGATGFEVFRNTSTNFPGGSPLTGMQINSFDDTSVSANQLYYYWVRAINSLGMSGVSTSDSGYAVAGLVYGTLTIYMTPDTATWTLLSYPSDYTGPTSGTGDLLHQSAVVGTYTVRFGSVAGYATPSDASGSVVANSETTFTVTYSALDSDGDGLSDLDEVNVYGTDPYNPDTDGDRYTDGQEVYGGSDPLDADSYLSGDLTFTSPVAGTVAKRGKLMLVNWSGDSALGTADISLVRGTNFWILSAGVSCSASSMSGYVPLPADLVAGTNYHVLVQGTGSDGGFGDSDMFSVVTECHGDYDGDGKADLCLYYPPWGMWFVLRSAKGFWYQQFGWDGPTPIPADYDGDGRTDLAVFDPNTGTWYVLTWAWEFYTLQFGSSDMEPVPADYDGDGWIDFAVYFPADGTWYILTWAGDYYSVRFGWWETEPVPGDYDSDGVSDVGVYYEAGGTWYLYTSTDGFRRESMGGPGMVAMPDDYDGDGTTDPAVYDSASGTWYIKMSTEGDMSVQFGWVDPTPVSGDYDGDGRADLGLVYGPLGLWYQLMSTDGYAYQQFGWEGPIPLD